MPSPQSDTLSLLKQAALGNNQAKEALLNRHRDRLRRMVAVRLDPRLLRRVDASDIVQETLLVASRRFDRYLVNEPIAFYPWLRQLAWDRLIDVHRRHLYTGRRSCAREQEPAMEVSGLSIGSLAVALVDDAEGPLSRLVRSEICQRVRSAVASMPQVYREILILRHLEQLSTQEASEVLQISRSAAKMRHFRAVEQLRALLDDLNTGTHS